MRIRIWESCHEIALPSHKCILATICSNIQTVCSLSPASLFYRGARLKKNLHNMMKYNFFRGYYCLSYSPPPTKNGYTCFVSPTSDVQKRMNVFLQIISHLQSAKNGFSEKNPKFAFTAQSGSQHRLKETKMELFVKIIWIGLWGFWSAISNISLCFASTPVWGPFYALRCLSWLKTADIWKLVRISFLSNVSKHESF